MSNPLDLPLNTGELKAQARQAALKVGEHLTDRANLLRDSAADARYNTQDFIQTNPWQSIAIAVGIGFLFGALFARR